MSITIQSKRTVIFRRDVPGAGEQTFRLDPTAVGEFTTAPDWVRDDPYFKLLESDGSVVEVAAVKPHASKVAKPEELTEVPPPVQEEQPKVAEPAHKKSGGSGLR